MPNRYAIIASAPQIDANRDGQISAGEWARAAMKGGLFVALGIICLFSAVRAAIWGGPSWVRLPWLALSLGLLVASCFGAWWLLWAFYQQIHRWKADDRRRAIEAEAYERDRLEGLQDQIKPRITQLQVDDAVELLLSHYYADKPWQRHTIKSLSDPLWNIANDNLKKAGIRRGRNNHLELETFDEAWRAYLKWRRSTMHAIVGEDGELIRD